MKRLNTMILLFFMLVGCTSIRDKTNEVSVDKQYIKNLEAQVVSLQTEIENQKIEIKNFLIKEAEIMELHKPLSDDEQNFLDFYNEFYPANIYWGEAGARIKVDINYFEPLRMSPSEQSPFLTSKNLTYSNEIDKSNIIEAEFLYTSMGETGEYWCLVVLDKMVGYVKESSIVNYKYNTNNYEALEEFSDLKIGVTVEAIMELFGDKVQYVDSPNGYYKLLYISFTGLSYRDDNGKGITFAYNPNTRIVDFIKVGITDYSLESGYKVGDRLEEVFSYYDNLYLDVTEKYHSVGLSDNDRVYEIGNGYTLELNGRDGLVVQIIINHGYNIYT